MLSARKKGETVEDFRRVFPLLKGAGIGTYSTWVIGLPGETEADRRMSADLRAELASTSSDVFVYIGIPKSAVYEELLRSGGYEFKEPNGMLYPRGYLRMAQDLYGEDDPRCRYVASLHP
jgi:radical SAM superfamily enzyme YgiQ (UPF0313 family)